MIISSSLSVRDHVDYILQVCNQRLYLLNKLKHAGLDEQGLAIVFQAIVVSRVLYALPAWFGQLTQLDIGRIIWFVPQSTSVAARLSRLISGAVGRDG